MMPSMLDTSSGAGGGAASCATSGRVASISAAAMVRRIILIPGEGVRGDGIPTLRSRGPLVPTRGEARKCLTFGVSIADFLGTAIRLELDATTRESVLDAMVGLLQVPERSRTTLLRLLARRELLGSTAV